MKEAKDLDFNNLVNLVRGMNLGLPEEIVIKLDQNEDNTGLIASVGVHVFKVGRVVWDRFCGVVKGGHVDEFVGLLKAKEVDVEYEIAFEDEERDKPVMPVFGENWDKLPPEVENLIIERGSGVMSVAAGVIGKIATIVNEVIDRVARDGDIIKDRDVMMTFDTEFGEKFNPVICLDYIPTIIESLEPIQIVRTPMTEEDRERYFGKDADEIDRLIKQLIEVINVFYSSKLVSSSKLIKDLVVSVIDGAIVSQFLDLHIKFISFGGFDNWRLTGDLTPNSEACHAIMDVQVEEIYKFLNSIPLQEGVDYWAIDLKTLGIYGRNNENHLVTGPLVEESDAITARYCDGLVDLLKLRLSMNDNKHIFTMM